jgi:hypothetical protein
LTIASRVFALATACVAVCGGGVEASECDEGVVEATAKSVRPSDRRVWWEGCRDECLEGFIRGGNADVAAGCGSVHSGVEPKIGADVILGSATRIHQESTVF